MWYFIIYKKSCRNHGWVLKIDIGFNRKFRGVGEKNKKNVDCWLSS